MHTFHDKKCAACGAPYHESTGHCFTHRTVLCGSCAGDFSQWMRRRMGQMQAWLRKHGSNETFHDCAMKSIIGDPPQRAPQDGQECVVWRGNDLLHKFMRKSLGFTRDGKLVTYSIDGTQEETWDRWQYFGKEGS